MHRSPGRATTEVAMGAFLAVVFVVSAYRYTSGRGTGEQYYLTVSFVSGLAFYGLQRVRHLFSGWAETAVRTPWYLPILLIRGAVVQMWRYRNTRV